MVIWSLFLGAVNVYCLPNEPNWFFPLVLFAFVFFEHHKMGQKIEFRICVGQKFHFHMFTAKPNKVNDPLIKIVILIGFVFVFSRGSELKYFEDANIWEFHIPIHLCFQEWKFYVSVWTGIFETRLSNYLLQGWKRVF